MLGDGSAVQVIEISLPGRDFEGRSVMDARFKPLFMSSVLLIPSEVDAHRPRRGCDGLGKEICAWKVFGGNQGLGFGQRSRRLCKTRCDKRDDVQVSECSTSYLPANLSFVEESLSGTGGEGITGVAGAFSSMVFMLRSLQSYALGARSADGANVQTLLAAVQADMHCSLVWLFQQVFANTPRLMLSLMIILANFLAFSTLDLEQQQEVGPGLPRSGTRKAVMDPTSSPDVFISGAFANQVSPSIDDEELFMVSMLEQAAEEQKIRDGKLPHAVEIVPAAALVAPVSVHLESDSYECFDRTELLYQDALRADHDNPLILANYAEFLFLVRRDYERAHHLFRLALRADPEDAEIICRYGKFLWLVHGNRRAAEEAYRAAMAAEPSNPFYAGCYAHFLWHSGEDQAASRLIGRVPRRNSD